MKHDPKDKQKDEQELLEELFCIDLPLWKGKYKVSWCNLCETAIISCPEENCGGTSCNGGACEKCSAALSEFNRCVSTYMEDYLSEEDMKIYYKAKRLKDIILESIRMGDNKIDWDKMKAKGKHGII